MNERYTYATVTGGRDNAREVARSAADAGGTVVGAWSGLGGIGWWDDEVAILVGWTGATASVAVEGERLYATARPTAVAVLEPGGVFAHRWFHIDSADWDEFLELSTGAWPAFEGAYGATIEGFLRSEDGERVLLITRYPSLAAWETSRGALRESDADVAESGRRFLRRREITRRSIVRTGSLVDLG